MEVLWTRSSLFLASRILLLTVNSKTEQLYPEQKTFFKPKPMSNCNLNNSYYELIQTNNTRYPYSLSLNPQTDYYYKYINNQTTNTYKGVFSYVQAEILYNFKIQLFKYYRQHNYFIEQRLYITDIKIDLNYRTAYCNCCIDGKHIFCDIKLFFNDHNYVRDIYYNYEDVEKAYISIKNYKRKLLLENKVYDAKNELEFLEGLFNF